MAVSSSRKRVLDAATAAGLIIEIQEFPEGTKTANDAAAAVGCFVDQIVKSMVFDADGELILALTSGGNRVDGQALAALAGATSCGPADATKVRTQTGFAIGGVAPFGHMNPVRTWIDPTLLGFEKSGLRPAHLATYSLSGRPIWLGSPGPSRATSFMRPRMDLSPSGILERHLHRAGPCMERITGQGKG